MAPAVARPSHDAKQTRPQPRRRTLRVTQLFRPGGAGCQGHGRGVGGTGPVADRQQQSEAMQAGTMEVPERGPQQVRLPGSAWAG